MYTRAIDELGRVVIPREIRDKMGVKEKENLEVEYKDGEVIMRKEENHCIICGEYNRTLIETNKGLICTDCIDEIKNIKLD